MDHAISGPATQTVTISGIDYKLPFADALPPLSEDAYAALRDCIKANGIRQLVYINEYNEVLDGQHRMKIAAELGIQDQDIPKKVFRNLSAEEAEEIAYGTNCKRRQLSKEDLVSLCLARRHAGWSLRKISKLTGVPHSTVARYLKTAGVPDGTPASAGKDGKTYPAVRASERAIVERRQEARMLRAEGKTHGEIAMALGVSRRTVATDLSHSLRPHPELDAYPDMTAEEFSCLKDSILELGLLSPITLFATPTEDLIVDGRQRYRACIELGVDPRFRYFDGSGSVESLIHSRNYFRRHYTDEQMAEILRKLAEYEKATGVSRGGPIN